MYIRNGKPEEKNYDRILINLYLDSEIKNGKTPFKNYVLGKIKRNESISPVIKLLDKNYANATSGLQNIQEYFYISFIGLYADNGRLLAHAKLNYNFGEHNETKIEIDGIHIYELEEFLCSANSDVIRWVQGMYSVLLNYIMDEIVPGFKVTTVELVSTADNKYFWNAMDNYGFTLISGEDDNGVELRFQKQIKEKGKVYERCYPNKQD